MLATTTETSDRRPRAVESSKTACHDHALDPISDAASGTQRAATAGVDTSRLSTEGPPVPRKSFQRGSLENPEHRLSSTSFGSDDLSIKQARITLEQQRMPALRKNKGVKGFLTLKEPSTLALQELANAHTRAEKVKAGVTGHSGVSNASMQRLPGHVPRVNSKWDGLPDSAKRRDADGKIGSWSKEDYRLTASSKPKISTSSSIPEAGTQSGSAKRHSAQSTSRSSYTSVSPWPEPPVGYENASSRLGFFLPNAHQKSIPKTDDAEKYAVRVNGGDFYGQGQSQPGNDSTVPLIQSNHFKARSSGTYTPTSPSPLSSEEQVTPSTLVSPPSVITQHTPPSATRALPAPPVEVINFSRPRPVDGGSPTLPRFQISGRHDDGGPSCDTSPTNTASDPFHSPRHLHEARPEPRLSSIATPAFVAEELDDSSLTQTNDDEFSTANDDVQSLAPSELSAQWHLSPRERLGLGGTLKKDDSMPWETSNLDMLSDEGTPRADRLMVGKSTSPLLRPRSLRLSRKQSIKR